MHRFILLYIAKSSLVNFIFQSKTSEIVLRYAFGIKLRLSQLCVDDDRVFVWTLNFPAIAVFVADGKV
jgi:hypothetical protein